MELSFDVVICDQKTALGSQDMGSLDAVDSSLPFVFLTDDPDPHFNGSSSRVVVFAKTDLSSKILEAKLRIVMYKMAA